MRLMKHGISTDSYFSIHSLNLKTHKVGSLDNELLVWGLVYTTRGFSEQVMQHHALWAIQE